MASAADGRGLGWPGVTWGHLGPPGLNWLLINRKAGEAAVPGTRSGHETKDEEVDGSSRERGCGETTGGEDEAAAMEVRLTRAEHGGEKLGRDPVTCVRVETIWPLGGGMGGMWVLRRGGGGRRLRESQHRWFCGSSEGRGGGRERPSSVETERRAAYLVGAGGGVKGQSRTLHDLFLLVGVRNPSLQEEPPTRPLIRRFRLDPERRSLRDR